jgi:hypothetical protein
MQNQLPQVIPSTAYDTSPMAGPPVTCRRCCEVFPPLPPSSLLPLPAPTSQVFYTSPSDNLLIDASRGVTFDGFNSISHSCDVPLFASFERAHGGRASPSKTVILSNQLPQVIHTDTPPSDNQAGGRYVEI